MSNLLDANLLRAVGDVERRNPHFRSKRFILVSKEEYENQKETVAEDEEDYARSDVKELAFPDATDAAVEDVAKLASPDATDSAVEDDAEFSSPDATESAVKDQTVGATVKFVTVGSPQSAEEPFNKVCGAKTAEKRLNEEVGAVGGAPDDDVRVRHGRRRRVLDGRRQPDALRGELDVGRARRVLQRRPTAQ